MGLEAQLPVDTSARRCTWAQQHRESQIQSLPGLVLQQQCPALERLMPPGSKSHYCWVTAPLTLAAVKGGHITVLEWLRLQQLLPNERMVDIMLEQAIQTGTNIAIFNCLWQQSLQSPLKSRSIHYAVLKSGQYELFLFLEAQSNFNTWRHDQGLHSDKVYELSCAAEGGSVPMLKHLLDEYNDMIQREGAAETEAIDWSMLANCTLCQCHYEAMQWFCDVVHAELPSKIPWNNHDTDKFSHCRTWPISTMNWALKRGIQWEQQYRADCKAVALKTDAATYW